MESDLKMNPWAYAAIQVKCFFVYLERSLDFCYVEYFNIETIIG